MWKNIETVSKNENSTSMLSWQTPDSLILQEEMEEQNPPGD
jgi:hypothetical protein